MVVEIEFKVFLVGVADAIVWVDVSKFDHSWGRALCCWCEDGAGSDIIDDDHGGGLCGRFRFCHCERALLMRYCGGCVEEG